MHPAANAALNALRTYLACLVEASSCDLVSEWIVEADGVYDVLVSLEFECLGPFFRVPYFARAVVAARDELRAALVEAAVRQRQDVSLQKLEQMERRSTIRVEIHDQL